MRKYLLILLIILTLFAALIILELTNNTHLLIHDPCVIGNQQMANREVKESGHTIIGITIGKSTINDVINILGEPDNTSPNNSFINIDNICDYQYVYLKENILQTYTRHIWFSEGIVIAISFSGSKIDKFDDTNKMSLQFLEDKYSRPELVEYSEYGSLYRTITWPQHGIQATVDLSGRPSNSSPNEFIELNNVYVTRLLYYLPDRFPLIKTAPFFTSRDRPWNTDVSDPYIKDPFLWD